MHRKFDRETLERAVELQARGYRLVRWLEKAIETGFVAPEAAHAYATLEDAAHAWIEGHYLNIPDAARPAREDLEAFSKLFSTYLTNTFDLEANPGMRLFSPNAHCFCPMCSWLVRAPHLQAKKVAPAHRRTAERMKRGFLRNLAAVTGASTPEDAIDAMLADPSLREPIGLCTHASDLLRRLEGVAIGPASLARAGVRWWTVRRSSERLPCRDPSQRGTH